MLLASAQDAVSLPRTNRIVTRFPTRCEKVDGSADITENRNALRVALRQTLIFLMQHSPLEEIGTLVASYTLCLEALEHVALPIF